MCLHALKFQPDCRDICMVATFILNSYAMYQLVGRAFNRSHIYMYITYKYIYIYTLKLESTSRNLCKADISSKLSMIRVMNPYMYFNSTHGVLQVHVAAPCTLQLKIDEY